MQTNNGYKYAEETMIQIQKKKIHELTAALAVARRRIDDLRAENEILRDMIDDNDDHEYDRRID
jgi:hypothetical protein